jgi:hypothetical protein
MHSKIPLTLVATGAEFNLCDMNEMLISNIEAIMCVQNKCTNQNWSWRENSGTWKKCRGPAKN